MCCGCREVSKVAQTTPIPLSYLTWLGAGLCRFDSPRLSQRQQRHLARRAPPAHTRGREPGLRPAGSRALAAARPPGQPVPPPRLSSRAGSPAGHPSETAAAATSPPRVRGGRAGARPGQRRPPAALRRRRRLPVRAGGLGPRRRTPAAPEEGRLGRGGARRFRRAGPGASSRRGRQCPLPAGAYALSAAAGGQNVAEGAPGRGGKRAQRRSCPLSPGGGQRVPARRRRLEACVVAQPLPPRLPKAQNLPAGKEEATRRWEQAGFPRAARRQPRR